MNKKAELQAQRNELFGHSENTLARIKELDVGIQAVIDKEAEPEEVYSIGDRFVGRDGANYLLNTIADGDHKVHLANMKNGRSCNGLLRVGCAARITAEELLHLHGIIHVTRYWDNAKQEKVGEEAEEVKVKVELRHGDYGITQGGCPQIFIKYRSSREEIWAGILYAEKKDHFEDPVLNSNGVLGNIFDDIAAKTDQKVANGIKAKK